MYLSARLDKPKSVQCSNWDADVLSPRQVEYAALDAWVSRQVFLAMARVYAGCHGVTVGAMGGYRAVASQSGALFNPITSFSGGQGLKAGPAAPAPTAVQSPGAPSTPIPTPTPAVAPSASQPRLSAVDSGAGTDGGGEVDINMLLLEPLPTVVPAVPPAPPLSANAKEALHNMTNVRRS